MAEQQLLVVHKHLLAVAVRAYPAQTVLPILVAKAGMEFIPRCLDPRLHTLEVAVAELEQIPAPVLLVLVVLVVVQTEQIMTIRQLLQTLIAGVVVAVVDTVAVERKVGLVVPALSSSTGLFKTTLCSTRRACGLRPPV